MNNKDFTQTPSVNSVSSSLPGIWELIRETFSIYKKKMKVFLILILMLFFLPLVLVGFPLIISILGLSLLSLDTSSPLFILLFIVVTLIVIVAFIAMILFSLLVNVSLFIAIKEREREIGIKELFSMARHKVASYLLVSLLATLAIVGGFFLFIIPGIIMSIWFSLALVVFISENLKGRKALSRSKQLVKGHWWSVFWKFLVFNVIIMTINIILGLIPLIGGFLGMFLLPFSIIFSFLIYEGLKEMSFINYSENIEKI